MQAIVGPQESSIKRADKTPQRARGLILVDIKQTISKLPQLGDDERDFPLECLMLLMVKKSIVPREFMVHALIAISLHEDECQVHFDQFS